MGHLFETNLLYTVKVIQSEIVISAPLTSDDRVWVRSVVFFSPGPSSPFWFSPRSLLILTNLSAWSSANLRPWGLAHILVYSQHPFSLWWVSVRIKKKHAETKTKTRSRKSRLPLRGGVDFDKATTLRCATGPGHWLARLPADEYVILFIGKYAAAAFFAPLTSQRRRRRRRTLPF